MLEVETGGLNLPAFTLSHMWNGSKMFSLLEVETGVLDLPVSIFAHV